MHELNMRFLKKSRRRLQPGDVFCYSILPERYHYGRVICTDAMLGKSTRNLLLLYFYRATSSVLTEVPELNRDDLLIPPVLAVDRAWWDGYFMHVDHRDIKSEDRLAVNCFYWEFWNKYMDEYGHQLNARYEPCGFYGITGYGVIDRSICMALGLETRLIEGDSSLEGCEPLSDLITNRRAVTIRIRLPYCGAKEVDQSRIEDAVNLALRKTSDAAWEASESHKTAFIMDYRVKPGRVITAVKTIRRVLSALGIVDAELLLVKE